MAHIRASAFRGGSIPSINDPVDNLRALIRDIPDFPKPGIVFKDITPLLADPAGLAMAVPDDDGWGLRSQVCPPDE